jgi:hypothetical protein
MTIDICKTTSDPDVADKTSTTTIIQGSVNIEPTSIISQLDPVFIVDYDSRYLAANYIICQELGRKYFCTVSVNTAKRCVISCNVDPLSSFDLSSCLIGVIRNEGIGAPTMYPDPKLPVYPSKKNIGSIVMQEISGLLTANGSWCYVLTVIGGTPNF